jgi:hypothetical protein
MHLGRRTIRRTCSHPRSKGFGEARRHLRDAFPYPFDPLLSQSDEFYIRKGSRYESRYEKVWMKLFVVRTKTHDVNARILNETARSRTAVQTSQPKRVCCCTLSVLDERMWFWFRGTTDSLSTKQSMTQGRLAFICIRLISVDSTLGRIN